MILIKSVSSMEKVFYDKEPIELEDESTILKNEKLNFQIVIKNEGSKNLRLHNIKVRGSISEYVSVRTVEFVPSLNCPNETDEYYLSTSAGVFPDLLKPIGKNGITLISQKWKSVWVTVYNKNGFISGEYPIFFDVVDENGIVVATTNYKVKVKEGELPENEIKITNWIHYDCIAQIHNVKLFGKSFYAIFDKYLDAYLACGNNMLFVPIFTPPLDTIIGGERKTAQLIGVKQEKDGYHFSFGKLKEFISCALKKGIKYFEFSHLFTQWGGESAPKIMAKEKGTLKRIFGWENSASSKEYLDFLNAFLPRLYKCLKKWGISEKCYFHLTDEPNAAHLENYCFCRNNVKKYLKEIPIMDALSDYAFYEKKLVDIPVVLTSHYQIFKDHKVNNAMAYYCCEPSNGFYSNRLLNMPLQRCRIIGFQLFVNGAQGFLHWGFNFYNTAYSLEEVNPYEDTAAGGFFPSGDSFVVYPKGNGVLMTMRGEILNEAMQDFRLCILAAQRVGAEKVKQLLESYGVKNFNEYPRSIKIHNEIKEKLLMLF